ncbi:hypothetical protein [Faecalibacterium duncaniae]
MAKSLVNVPVFVENAGPFCPRKTFLQLLAALQYHLLPLYDIIR